MVRQSTSRTPRDNWSLRYIELQQAYDRRVRLALGQALDSATAAMHSLEGKVGVGAAVQRAQTATTRAVLLEIIDELFRTLGIVVREGQEDSAAAAKQATLLWERDLIKRIFEDERSLKDFESTEIQRARRNAHTMVTRILNTQQPLAKRLYKSRALAKGQLNRVVNSHLARGSSARDMAKDIRQFVSPDSPGGVSYVAQRLARSEINNAFHAQSIEDMQDRPWVDQVYWKLSKSHPPRQPECKCDLYANIELFPADRVPPKPHPQCLCYVIPKLMGEQEFMNALISGQFREWQQKHR